MGRKKLEPTVSGKLTSLANIMRANKNPLLEGVDTATNLMAHWRYIDFIDVKYDVPCLLLEWFFGARGILTGRLMKIEADPGIGKSSYVFMQYGMGQKSSNAQAAHHETEGAPPPGDYIAAMGCNPQDILMVQPQSLEDCLSKFEALCYELRKYDPQKIQPIIQGIDSISGLGTDIEDDDIEKAKVAELGASGAGLAGHARTLSKWFRDRGCRWLNKHDVLMIVTAQLKDNIVIGGMPGQQLPADQKKKTIADAVLNYNATYRLRMRSSTLRDKKTNVDIGEIVRIKTMKNKVSPKHREIEVPLLRGEGFQFLPATADFLRYHSPITLPSGSTFSLEQRGAWLDCPTIGKKVNSNEEGKTDLILELCQNEDLLMAIREAFKVRGFGFKFEQQYIPSKEEIEDNQANEVGE